MDRCAACGAPDPAVFFDVDGVPVNSCVLLDTRAEALAYPHGRLRLAVCRSCGFIGNLDFDPDLATYDEGYEESQACSPKFRAFARSLAEYWVDHYGLRGRLIVEIGCGKGEFLHEMCQLGGNRGVGIDPAFDPQRLPAGAAQRLTVYRERFGPQHAGLEPDAVVCRHTLEHIGDVSGFLHQLRSTIATRPEVPVLFEVPDVGRVLRDTAFWDVYYEHCSYFTAGSLARLFRRAGFDVHRVASAYDSQYLLLEATPGGGGNGSPLALEENPLDVVTGAEAFAKRLADEVQRHRAEVTAAAEQGRTVAVWGGGSKGVAYLTTLGVREAVAYAVDINPYKQGKFIPTTGHLVVGPRDLADHPPDLVIVMNAVYLTEVAATLAELNISAELQAA